MKKHVSTLKYNLLLIGVAFSISTFAQQPGNLDVSFGIDGITTFGESNRYDQARAMTIRPDGRIVIVGKVAGLSGQDNDIVIAQVLSNGSMDSSFGQNGMSVTDLGGTTDIGQDVLLKDNGATMVIGGSNQSGSFQAGLLQYDTIGDLDDTFGNSGVVFWDITGIVSMTAIDGGYFYGIGNNGGDIPFIKFEQTGILENTFGNGGIELIDLGAVDVGGRVVVQNDGRILFTGRTTEIGAFPDGIVGRLNPDGTLDLAFNGTGWVELALSNNIDYPADMALLPDGKILLVGSVYDNITLEGEIFAIRLLSDGNFDTTFGTNGIVYYDIGAGDDNASTVVLQPDGKAIIGGTANNGNDNNFSLIRINEDGSLDPTFGNNGIVITEVSPDNDGIADMELQADGKLVVAGTARVGTNDDIAIARYHTGINTSVAEIGAESKLSVFPNPAVNQLTVTSEKTLNNVELLDALGRTVLTQTSNANRFQLDLSQIPSGIYLLRATDGERMFTQKVVKE